MNTTDAHNARKSSRDTRVLEVDRERCTIKVKHTHSQSVARRAPGLVRYVQRCANEV